jgi:predicted nucleotidyltransferase
VLDSIAGRDYEATGRALDPAAGDRVQSEGKRARRPDLSRLPEVFRRYPDVQAVYLFGSAAAGTERGESDLDLAVFPGSAELRKHRLQILADLAERGFCRVDLVFPDEEDVVLRYEAVRLNVLVYERPGFDRGSTYSNVVRKYLDFLPYLAVQRAAYKKRLLSGQG